MLSAVVVAVVVVVVVAIVLVESGRFVPTDVSYPVDSYPKLR